jgi:protease IV
LRARLVARDPAQHEGTFIPMTLDAETIADRRRLRRKLSFWRVAGIGGLIAGAVAVGLVAAGRTGGLAGAPGAPQIARITIGGFITGDQQVTELFRRVGDAPNVAGVVIAINSPGGSTTGAEELYRGIRGLAAKKPLVAFVDGTAASGGYIAALAADRIVARETSLVGSVGVLFQYPELTGLLNNLGVKVEAVKSSPLKAEPSGFNPTSPEARAALQQVVDDTFQWFRSLVAERRRLSPEELAPVADGRIFNGRQALALKMVDQLGAERDAVAHLEERGVAKDLPIRDWKPRREGGRFSLFTWAAVGAELLGLGDTAERLRDAAAFAPSVTGSGLLALWRPALEP